MSDPYVVGTYPPLSGGGGGGGGLTINTITLPLLLTAGNLTINQASAISSGYLSQADWIRFNAATGGYLLNNFTLNGADIANKYVTLSSAPTAPTLAILNIITGLEQQYGVDFTIVGSQLRWTGLGLDGFLVSGNKLSVQFY